MSKEDKNLWVYDIETIASIFTYVAVNTVTEETVEFVIHKDRDDSVAFRKHLNSVKGLIGFNNIGFDYPVIHLFLNSHFVNATETIDVLYEKAQFIINHQIQLFLMEKIIHVHIPIVVVFMVQLMLQRVMKKRVMMKICGCILIEYQKI